MREQYGFSAADDHERHCRQPHHPCLQRSRRVATDGGEDMSNELAEMLDNPAYWQQHFGGTFFTFFEHHNCVRVPRVYHTGISQQESYTINTFSTDEIDPDNQFFRDNIFNVFWPTQRQPELVCYAGGVSSSITGLAGSGGVYCDAEGRLFTWGQRGFGSIFRGMNGHGTDLSRDFQNVPRQVFGESGELASRRFIKCGVSFTTTSALADEGVLYFSGDASGGVFGDGQSSPRRFYHKPLLGYTWKTYDQGHCVAAIDFSGNLFEWGRAITDGIDKYFPTKVESDFVDEIEIINPGAGVFTLLGVSDPQLPGGRKMTFGASRVGGLSFGPLEKVWVIDPGKGYTSPPNISFAATQTSVAPVLSCKLFSSSWKECFCSGIYPQNAYISADGYMYCTGSSPAAQINHAGVATSNVVSRPRKYLERKVTKVALGDGHGIFIDETGGLYGWGHANTVYYGGAITIFPGFQPGKVGKLADGTFIDVASNSDSVMALREDGVIFSAGRITNGQLGRGPLSQLQLATHPLAQVFGSIRAKRIFRGSSTSFVALRDQTYDAAGNPVYPE